MNTGISVRWGPERTPTVIKSLISITSFIAVAVALINPLFTQWMGILGPQEFLSLSLSGMMHFYLWQPLTYLFVYSPASWGGITVIYLLSLVFMMCILWILGSDICENVGSKHCLTVYFATGILGGLTTLLMMFLTGHTQYLSGPTISLFGLFTVWTMLHADAELYLFFLFPILTKWMFAGLIGIYFIISLSQLDFVSLAWYLSGPVYGYLYGVAFLGLRSPYPFLYPIDRAILRWTPSLRASLGETQAKIYDIQTGKPIVDDDAFIDLMLTKIAKHGESALSTSERVRMKEISDRRSKKR